MAFKKSDRQRIVDGYLAATGRNLFIASEFIDWLEGKEDHEAYPWFFGKDDAAAAREYRIDLARRMASGLRITVSQTDVSESKVVSITTREYPAYVSPMAHRTHGGGYHPVDPKDAAVMDELRRQGCTALKAWLSRYRGVFEEGGVSVAEIEGIAGMFDAKADIA